MSVKAALQTIKYYTSETWRLHLLAGGERVHIRRQILAHLIGRECTKKESGLTRIRTMLHNYFDCEGCEAEKEKQFAERAEARLAERNEQ